ncbi:hypothetical protein [Luteimonas deserti]|uniref:Uncharacterized protein n=1 Tax=Luteimonas deserti TaxID=2752306 RepID=A0A7Z0QQ46_9GAMM|nr:hypothetical protein [Luteimonas deserti]NYZ61906.1 hypothetical protein [Luteimonas deserti]
MISPALCAARWAALALTLLLALPAAATEQIPDTLLLDGQPRPLHSEPLSAYLDQPDAWERFRALFATTLGTCSANWRGYRATWRLEDDRLQLLRMVAGACDRKAPEIALEALLPGRTAPVDADWYSGTLVVALGERGGNDHMGYSTRYPRYALIEIEQGRRIAQREVTHDELQALRVRERAGAETTP